MMKYIWILLILLSVQSSLFADEANTNDENKIKRLESRMYHIEMSVKQNKSNVDKLKNTIQNHALTLVLFAFFLCLVGKNIREKYNALVFSRTIFPCVHGNSINCKN
ncbi:MAG: hypothetical protein JKY19_14485 [Alcanivoracaceae bacterium]|nr:hypothetical protein [Alcanivoracaceae bacterium]